MNDNLPVASINDYPVEKFNRLFPTTLTQISPLHKVMVNVVSIDPNPTNGEVYELTKGKGPDKKVIGLALTKIACLKLMTAANVIMEESKPIFPGACQRCMEVARQTRLAPQCGPCDSKNDVRYQVSILVPEPSGGYRKYVATKEVSKADTLAKSNPLEHMGANCETKALLRALRAGLGLKGNYSRAELQKPFAVALVVLNTHDPDLKAALIQRYAAGQDALFGSPAPQLSSPSSEFMALPGGDITSETVVLDNEPIGITGQVIDGDPADDLIPPWEQKPSDVPTCEECACIIEPNGSWTVEKIVDFSKRKYGRALCPKCQKAGGSQ